MRINKWQGKTQNVAVIVIASNAIEIRISHLYLCAPALHPLYDATLEGSYTAIGDAQFINHNISDTKHGLAMNEKLFPDSVWNAEPGVDIHDGLLVAQPAVTGRIVAVVWLLVEK